jgi:hypothetical protein
MAGRIIPLLLVASTFGLACGGGAGSAVDITLAGDELREFAQSLVLTLDEIPDAQADQPDEGWMPASGGESERAVLLGADIPEGEFLGAYARPAFVRPDDRTYTVVNTVYVFRSERGARAMMDGLRATDVAERGEEFARTSSAESYEVLDFAFEGGEDAFALALTGPATVEGTTEQLVHVQAVFRRGAIVAETGMTGFVPLDEELLRDLADRLDERIQAGLDRLD